MVLSNRTTRSGWYFSQIRDFLDDSTKQDLNIDLYSSEVKKIKKFFPELVVSVGDYLGEFDNRRHCKFSKP